ncbi:MAG TPA: hypothetical protein VN371_04320 [Chlorobaculum sp.]|nr:hypothetical protein [Chlorobaculum sp.]
MVPAAMFWISMDVILFYMGLPFRWMFFQLRALRGKGAGMGSFSFSVLLLPIFSPVACLWTAMEQRCPDSAKNY